MAKNIFSLQLLRNTSVYESKDLAIAGLKSLNTQDGVIALARYKEGDATKTLFGINYTTASSGASYTIYDGDMEAIKALEDAIKTLSGSGEGSITKQVQEAIDGLKGGVSGDYDTLKKLEDAIKAETSARTQAISDLKGSATSSADTLGKLEGLINQEVSDRKAAISDLNAESVAAEGLVVSDVQQSAGKITATTAKLGDVKLGGYTADTGATGAIAETDSLNTAINKIVNTISTASKKHDITSTGKTITVTTGDNGTNLELNVKADDHVLKADAENGLYSDIKISAVTLSEANVKEAFALVGHDGVTLGDPIKIYKDSALLSVALLHADGETLPTYDTESGEWTDIDEGSQIEANAALCYAYSNVSGETEVVAVPVGSFLQESEFKDGLTVEGGIVSVKKDDSSESFLSVSSNGVKVSGIQSAIDKAKGEAQTAATAYTDSKLAELTGTTTGKGSTTQMTVAVTQENGKITSVQITDANIATKSEVEAAKTAAGEAASAYTDSKIAALGATVTGTGENVTVTVTQANGVITNVAVEDSGVATKEELQSVSGSLKSEIDSISAEIGNSVTSVKMTGGTAQIAEHELTINTDGSQISMTNYSKAGSYDAISASDTVNSAVGKLEKKAEDNAASIAANTALITKNTLKAKDDAIVLDVQDSGTTISLGTIDAGTY